MTELLSKDILYEPLKELSTKYPDYLDNNKPPKLSQEDYDNFKKQHGYVNDVLAIFESDSPNKDSVLDLMTKIQECGSPPKDIIGDFDKLRTYLYNYNHNHHVIMPLVSHPTPNMPDVSVWLMIPIVALGILIGVLVVLPILGVLTRHRANFNPKGLSLDPESNPTVGAKVDSYWSMAKRVKEVEGIPGFFKGLCPTLLSEVVVGFVALIPVPAILAGGFFGTLAAIVGFILVGCIALPFDIVIKRAIVTPYNLSISTPRQNIRKLVTPTEMANPLTMINSTLVQVLALRLVINAVTINIFRPVVSIIPYIGPIIWQIFTIALVILLCPLDVLQTRLMVQPLGQQDWDEETNHNKYEDAVVNIRQQPYHGVGDALRAIKDEEGTTALARGWWFTLIGQLSIAFSL
ncbi:hypothetical protein E3Q12_00781 [Wallemia mellicola]|nr:hypothetical protein E3Q12_00781 [Wallemia mellicola]TIC71148.1 hypothetical protein E3Q03_00728 [Wallemia mellicola]